MPIFKAILVKTSRSNGFAGVSALAFLALLGAGSADAQAPAGRDAKDSGKLEWGPIQNELRTALYAMGDEYSLGKPMLFRLVIENLGSRALQVESTQVAINASMSVQRSDGTNVPYIAPGAQTGWGGPVLNAGERAVLFEGLDIDDQYLIASPGTYTVQFKGNLGNVAFEEIPAFAAIPASNEVTIRVTDGPVKPSRLVARALFDPVQASGWRLALYKEGDVVPVGRSSVNGAALSLTLNDGRALGEHHGVLIWVTASPSAITPPEPDVKSLSPAEAIGRCQWGEVYLWSANASAEELSTIRRLIATALKVEER